MKLQTTNKQFAVFDIDGTLYRWQLFHDLVEELTMSGVLPAQSYIDISAVWNKWRGGEMGWHNYEDTVVTILMKYLPTIDVRSFEAAAHSVVARSGHKVHHYPLRLLEELKAKGYLIIAISGSQQELLDPFCARYGFDIAVGALYERKDNKLTGKILRPTIDRKDTLLKELVATHQLSWEGSVAIGDSDGDGALLELVERPIAFNPSEGLFAIARTKGWPIVVERKNIAYRLEKDHEALVLADTIVY